jgi:large subunit ribosomal protein L18e
MENEISKTKIENRMRQKANPILVNAIVQLKKTNPAIAKILAMPRKKQLSLNLTQIDKMIKDGDKVFVPGKILSSGDITKKAKIVAWNASEKAVEKMKAAKIEFTFLNDEIKTNKDLKGVKILE